MKIGILIDRFNVGGVEKIAIEQVRALRESGTDAYLVVLRRKGVVDNAFSDLRKELPIIYLDDRLPRILRFSFRFPVFYFFSLFHITYPFFIPFVLKKKEFDYIIVHGTYTSFTAVAIRKLRKIQYSSFIWDPIGYILKRVYITKMPKLLFVILFNLSRFLDGMIIRNADAVLVGGNAHNTYLKSFSKRKPIVEIPPSVHSLNKLSSKKNNFVLLVTAWKRGKNPEYVYELLKKNSTMKIVMAGKWLEEAYRKEFVRFCKEKNIVKNIEILGEVSEKQLESLYKNTLVLLQINDDRGFGMPALEAAGKGTTFVIPEGQGVCKAFINGKDGYFVKEKNTKEILTRLNYLLRNPAKAASMGESAWNRIKDNYSWKTHAHSLISIIEKYGKI